MKVVLLTLIISLPLLGQPESRKVDKEKEALEAASVLDSTYTPPKAGDKSDVLIDFDEKPQMNDEEKEVVLRNYESNKSVYKEDSSDSIFERISKAYVRNLDKILTRKKAE